ncbi:hypothetical protein ANN_23004 [Periplaneta americana]|uniref:Uncharacterized protein n=1 Tax=Periplaneta americana TaxID=6978 RepID=A0ABQ8SK04_PERAM|nr:hypothetical protein ANN_23004 [Periplaneta americana]
MTILRSNRFGFGECVHHKVMESVDCQSCYYQSSELGDLCVVCMSKVTGTEFRGGILRRYIIFFEWRIYIFVDNSRSEAFILGSIMFVLRSSVRSVSLANFSCAAQQLNASQSTVQFCKSYYKDGKYAKIHINPFPDYYYDQDARQVVHTCGVTRIFVIVIIVNNNVVIINIIKIKLAMM